MRQQETDQSQTRGRWVQSRVVLLTQSYKSFDIANNWNRQHNSFERAYVEWSECVMCDMVPSCPPITNYQPIHNELLFNSQVDSHNSGCEHENPFSIIVIGDLNFKWLLGILNCVQTIVLVVSIRLHWVPHDYLSSMVRRTI